MSCWSLSMGVEIAATAKDVIDLLAGDGVIAVGETGFVEHVDSRIEVFDD